MPNYQEQPLTGLKWKRAWFVSIENPQQGEKAATFHEQIAKQTNDGSFSAEDAGSLRQPLSPTAAFNLRSPLDNTLILDAAGLPKTATHQDIYVLLHSVYLHLASLRDGVILPGATVPG